MIRLLITTLFVCVSTINVWSAEVRIGHRKFTIPDGYQLELAAGPPLTKRPICVDFDQRGRLYVAESSGSNDNVQKQLKERPHTILRLEDSNHDGTFDSRTVFADRMMFPEGATWHDGSLYVAAPPSIWKLTDTNGDGIADKREEWFQGKTLTGCANDLHGPYVGLDGWIYWCKGAFAEQTYSRPGQEPFVTRAAHIFRRRPDGGPVEPVMTGGMDNPVEVAFTLGGERIFTTTFFQHPAGGQRDGLVHAIYGGIYGKRHGVLDGHPRTGDLMPVLTHLGAAAPSGLTRLQSASLGFQDNLVTACFNLHRVIRHQLKAKRSTFETVNHDLVVCDDLDFHPTDVIEDADGSLLIVDTGGWYKLCCPTSQLKKPDVYGAIYRLSRVDAVSVQDARGDQIDWADTAVESLTRLLADPRPFVSQRATQELAKRGKPAIPLLTRTLSDSMSADARTRAVWSLCRISEPEARAAIRIALADASPQVRQAACHAVSVWRDERATSRLFKLLEDSSSPQNRRVAAEALGRIGEAKAVSHLIKAISSANDRILNHSLIYALIEIGNVEATRVALKSDRSSVRQAALIAIDQMKQAGLTPSDVCPLLVSPHPELRKAATFVAERHPEWGVEIANTIRANLASLSDGEPTVNRSQLSRLCHNPEVKHFLAKLLGDGSSAATKIWALDVLRQANVEPDIWGGQISDLLQSHDQRLIVAVVKLLAARENDKQLASPSATQLKAIAKTTTFSDEIRLMAMDGLPKPELDPDLFSFVLGKLAADQPLKHRSLAAKLIAETKPSRSQLHDLVDRIPQVGPLELSKILIVFAPETDEILGMSLTKALADCPSTASLPQQQIEALATNFGPVVSEAAQALYASTTESLAAKMQRLEDYLNTLPAGDVRRGQRVFHSEQTACFACHGMGYRGGDVGPDLTRIARIRSRRDLLESVLFPSMSFVRSYEPVLVVTTSGQTINGTVRDRTSDYVLLQIDATEQRRIDLTDVEQILPGKVSIMPAGLDQQLTKQQLADLLAFLESRK